MAGTSPGWISCPAPHTSARVRVLCFPYAGGSAATFRGWHEHLPPDVEVASVVLPGRDSRHDEPPLTDFLTLVRALADALRWKLDIPVAFFGHSMGALVAFELVRELRRRRLPIPIHLFVSAHRAPHLGVLNPGERPLHALSDSAFIGELQRRYGSTPELTESAELAALFLPLLRADLALCESYDYRAEEPLACSISAFGGAADRRVTRTHLAAWRRHTSRGFELRMVPGNHFFVRTDPHVLLPIMRQQLAQVMRRAPQAWS